MKHPVISASGSLKCHCVRLHRGDDLMLSIKELCREKQTETGSASGGSAEILALRQEIFGRQGGDGA